MDLGCVPVAAVASQSQPKGEAANRQREQRERDPYPPNFAKSSHSQLSQADAGRLYKLKYWDAVDADTIALQPLAEMLVDFHVNAGGHAIRELQELLVEHGAAIKPDGAWGPQTAQALQRIDPTDAYRALRARRIAYYERLAARQPDLRKFLKGWLNRVNAFPVL